MGHEAIFIKLNIPQNESNQHFNTPNMQPQFKLSGRLKIVKHGIQFNVLYLFVILFWMTIFKSDHIIRPHCVNDVWVSVHNGQDFVKNINHTSLQKNWDYNATKQQNNTESFLGQVMMILMVEMVVKVTLVLGGYCGCSATTCLAYNTLWMLPFVVLSDHH